MHCDTDALKKSLSNTCYVNSTMFMFYILYELYDAKKIVSAYQILNLFHLFW